MRGPETPPPRAQHNGGCSYLARVRPMPLSANLGTRANSQSVFLLHMHQRHGGKGPSVPWCHTADTVGQSLYIIGTGFAEDAGAPLFCVIMR